MNLGRFLPRSQFRRQAAMVGGGVILAQIIQALATPVLVRLYAPAAFGDWTLMLSVAGFGTAIGGLRYELAIVMAGTDEDAVGVAAVQTIFNLIVSLVWLAAIAAFAGGIAVLIGSPGLTSWLIAVPAIVFLTGLTQACTYWLIRKTQFKDLSISRLAQSALTASTQAIAFFFVGGVGGLIIGTVAGLAGFVLVFPGWRAWLSSGAHWRTIAIPLLLEQARKYSNFPKYTMPGGIAAVLRERGLIIVLGIFASTHIIGLYSLALRLVYFPVSLISVSFNPILLQRVASDEGVAAAAPYVRKLLLSLTSLGVPSFIVFAWFSRDIFSLLLGPNWVDAGVYGAIMAGPAFTYLIEGPLDRMLDVVGRQRVALGIEATYTAAVLVVFVYIMRQIGDSVLAVTSFSVLTMVYHVALVTSVYRLCHFPFHDLLDVGVRVLLLSIVTGVVLQLLSVVGNRVFELAAAVIGMLGYALVLLMAASRRDWFANLVRSLRTAQR